MLASGLADTVDNEEDLARFLTSSGHFNAAGAKPAAFLPNAKNGETSVFRHGSHPPASLWQIANDHVGAARTLHGAAIVKAKHVRSVLLDAVAQEPPPRHANIVNWPSSQADPDMTKAAQKERAALIAQHAEVLRR
ncbi:MAG: hypothetical protein SGJ20_01390 [Planctomycetota bacterium]|nr:hypothetical protein [Planctomycetota bacterium]